MQNYYKLLYVSVLYCVLFFKLAIANNKFINQIKSKYDVLNDMMVDILNDCDLEVGTVIINDYDESFFKALWTSKVTSAIILHYQWDFKYTMTGPRTKINAFIIAINTTIADFKRLMTNYKSSPTWDVLTPYFIIYRVKEGCTHALRFGKLNWTYSLTTIYFLCLDGQHKGLVYTYNPYSPTAPNFWINPTSNVKQYDSWTLLYREYGNDNFCSGFFFDRTLKLDGSLIKITLPLSASPKQQSLFEPGKIYNESILAITSIPQVTSITNAIISSLNVSVQLVFEKLLKGVTTNSSLLFRRLEAGSSDLSLYPTSPVVATNLCATRPSLYSAFYVIAQNTGSQSIIEKIIRFYSFWIFVITFLLVIIIINVLMASNGKNLSYAVLEIIRLFVGTALITDIKTMPLRIFFGVILIYFLVLQATFLGRFKAFTTGVVERDNIEKINDLYESRYNKFSSSLASSLLIDTPELHKKNKLVNDYYECIQDVIDNVTVACIEDYMYLLESSLEHHLHISKSPLSFNYYIYVTRENWPLKGRLDDLLSWIQETGLSELWTQEITEKFEIQAKIFIERKDYRAKPLPLETTIFAFEFLGMGLVIAFLVFIFEAWTGTKALPKKPKSTKRIVKTKKVNKKDGKVNKSVCCCIN